MIFSGKPVDFLNITSIYIQCIGLSHMLILEVSSARGFELCSRHGNYYQKRHTTGFCTHRIFALLTALITPVNNCFAGTQFNFVYFLHVIELSLIYSMFTKTRTLDGGRWTMDDGRWTVDDYYMITKYSVTQSYSPQFFEKRLGPVRTKTKFWV